MVSAQECNWTSGISARAMACCWPGQPVPMMPSFSSSIPGGSSSPLLDIRVLRLRRHFLASPAEAPIHLTFFHDARWNEPPPVSCYISILPRCRFNSLRFRFASRIRFFNFAGRGDFLLRSFSRKARFAARSLARLCSIAAANRSRAIRRFVACERESCTVTLTPLGRWRSVTEVEALFTCCPPGPEDRANVSSRSASLS